MAGGKSAEPGSPASLTVLTRRRVDQVGRRSPVVKATVCSGVGLRAYAQRPPLHCRSAAQLACLPGQPTTWSVVLPLIQLDGFLPERGWS
jgi:hypothetical protein